ncbi:thiamine pyrophosphate-binding protein [Anaerolineales bacterium]
MSFAHGGELIARALKAQGVSTIYTLCGGHIAPIYQGCENNGIYIIDTRHEQAAAHAADAHARLTRNIGVAVVTAGPGVTDAVTGVANAYQARSPMILIGGAAPLGTKGQGALQEMPQIEMFKTFTKASFTIERTEEIPEKMVYAFETALSGRPGPVFIEVPFDVLFNAIDDMETPPKVEIAPVEPPADVMSQLFELMRQAKRPVLIAGTQVYWDEAHDALRELTDQTQIPVYTNGGGRGTLSMVHPNCFKLARSKVLKEADLILLIGTPLDFRLKFGNDIGADVKLIQIENDAEELNHNRQADIALCANSRLILEALQEGLQGFDFSVWRDRVAELNAPYEAQQQVWTEIDESPINHFRLGAAINRIVDEETIVIGDGGDIVSACAKVINITLPGQWLDPGPLGCLGVGAPFAIAAKHLYPDKKVIIINGDGSFGLNGFEFDTLIRFDLPVVSIVGNDAGWGQIRTPFEQMMGEGRAIATNLARTRYDRIVEAMGGYGENVEAPEEIEAAILRALESPVAACVNVMLDAKGMSKTGASTPYIV